VKRRTTSASVGVAGTTSGNSLLRPLSYPTFRYYWTGAFISSIGSWLQLTAVLWLVRNMGGDTLVGVVNLVNWIPVLFLGLFAGAIADRMDRKRVVLWSQGVMMVCSILIGLCVQLAWVHDLVLMVFLAIAGIAYAIFVVAWIATIPVLVPREELLGAAALNNLQFNLARFVGPILGGLLLLAANDYVPFYANALSFATFMVLVVVSRTEMPPASSGSGSMLSKVLEGMRYVRGNRWMIKVLATSCGISFFGFSFIVLIPSVCRQILLVSGHNYGFLMGMTGLGALLGLLAVAFLKSRVGFKAMMALGCLLNAAFLAAFALSDMYWLSCILAAGAGGSFLLCNAAAIAALQRNTIPEMQGRISSMGVVSYVGVFPIGGLVLGILSDVVSLRFSLFFAGCACVAVALFVVFFVSVPGD